MSKHFLVPTDPVTERILIEVLAAMYKHAILKENAAATSEFPRPDVAATGVKSANTNSQPDATTPTASGQNDGELSCIT
jgi:hypothetical protein